MKKTFYLIGTMLLLATTASAQTYTCTGTTPNRVCTSTTGTRADVQAAINDASVGDGDTVFIGSASGPFPATFNWDATALSVVNKAIKLKGRGITKTIITKPCSGTPCVSSQTNMISFTCNNSTFTTEVSDFELQGEDNNSDGKKLSFQGTAVPSQNANGDWQGGVKIHDINFSTPPSNQGACQVKHYNFQGWIFGVMYHCIISDRIFAVNSACGDVNHGGRPAPPLAPVQPANSGYGQYAAGFPYQNAGDQIKDLAGTKDMLYMEDNIFHHRKGVTDSTVSRGGGMILCMRHNTMYGVMATHGTRETGNQMLGGRCIEMYNNLKCYNYNTDDAGHNANGYASEMRDGEGIYYNNFSSSVYPSGGPSMAQTTWGAKIAIPNGVFFFPMDVSWSRPPDGKSPWDDNQKADQGPDAGLGKYFTDERGNKHYLDAAYTHTPDVIAGLDQDNVNRLTGDSVNRGTPGQPNIGRFSDVYGDITPSPFSAITAKPNVTQYILPTMVRIRATYPTGMSNTNLTVPDNYWRGFTLRNSSTPNSPNSTAFHAYIIRSKTQSDGTQQLTIHILNGTCDQCAAGWNFTVGPLELRKVRNYFGVQGQGHSAPGSPIIIDTPQRPADGTLPRWLNFDARFMNWGNMYFSSHNETTQPPLPANWNTEISAGASHDSPGPNGGNTGGTYGLIFRGFYESLKPAGSVTKDELMGINAFANRPSWEGRLLATYNWDPSVQSGTIGAGPDGVLGTEDDTNVDTDPALGKGRTRIGADIYWVFPHAYSKYDSATMQAGLNPATYQDDTRVAAYKSFYSKGAGGFQYPHPLRGPAASLPDSAPTWDNANVTDTWNAGQSSSYTATANGQPPPAITVVSGLPASGWSFDGSTLGQGVISSLNPVATVAGSPVTIVLKATNRAGSANQTLKITVNAVSTLSVTLVSPVNDAPYTIGDTVPLQATVQGGTTPYTVKFFQGTTQIGTGTFELASNSYKDTWTPTAIGDYSVTATATDSAATPVTVTSTPAATIHVKNPVVSGATPTPATIIAH